MALLSGSRMVACVTRVTQDSLEQWNCRFWMKPFPLYSSMPLAPPAIPVMMVLGGQVNAVGLVLS